MSSHYAQTRPTSAPPRTQPPPKSGGLEASTLIAAAVASVVAATVVSKFWASGTIWATAMTPVIVAVVKEMIERPARRVSSVASRVAPSPVARTARRVAEPPPEADAPPPPVAGTQYTQMRVYGRERATPGRRWKLAIATGLLACLIAVAAMTLPELVAGRSVVSGSHHTTIFGGQRNTQSTPSKSETTTGEEKTTSQPQDTTTTGPDTTTTAPSETQTQPAPQSETQPPAQTQPQPVAPQTQTQPPAQTQPAPQETTPAPTP